MLGTRSDRCVHGLDEYPEPSHVGKSCQECGFLLRLLAVIGSDFPCHPAVISARISVKIPTITPHFGISRRPGNIRETLKDLGMFLFGLDKYVESLVMYHATVWMTLCKCPFVPE